MILMIQRYLMCMIMLGCRFCPSDWNGSLDVNSGGTTGVLRRGLAPSPIFRMLAGTMLTSVLTVGTTAVVTGTLAGRLGPDRSGATCWPGGWSAWCPPSAPSLMGVAVPRYVAMAQNDSERRAFLLGGFVLGVVPGLLIGGPGIALHNSAARLLFGKAQDHGLLSGALVLLIGNSCHALLYGFYRGQGRMGWANAWQLAVFVLGPAAVIYGPGRPTETGQILLCLGWWAADSGAPAPIRPGRPARWGRPAPAARCSGRPVALRLAASVERRRGAINPGPRPLDGILLRRDGRCGLPVGWPGNLPDHKPSHLLLRYRHAASGRGPARRGAGRTSGRGSAMFSSSSVT